MFRKYPDGVYRVPAFEQFPWLEAGFGTRPAGIWVRGPLATLKQVHSDRWICADGRQGCLGEADALLSQTPGLMIGVFTADCLPVLLVDPEHRAVAAVHAGWRGAARGILTAVITAMQVQFGSQPDKLLAAIGPAICGDCYEVGPEVARRFQHWFPEREDLDSGARLDLPEVGRRQLVEAGVPRANIALSGLCTHHGGEEFCSHRRTPGRAGRMLAAMGLRIERRPEDAKGADPRSAP